VLVRAARRGGYEGGGVAGAARLSVLSRGRCAGICLARSACTYECLREPGTGRGVIAFCRVVAGKRSVLRFIVKEVLRSGVCCGGSATLSDSRGAQRRLEIEGCPSPVVLGNGREARSAGLPPSPDNKAAPAHDR
jgi:hypothetical protein